MTLFIPHGFCKEGFKAIRDKFFGYFKKIGPPQEVGKTRYRIGLVMFVLPLLFDWMEPYTTTILPGYESYRIVYNIGGDVVFIASFFILGGNFWDKLRTLFIHRAKSTTLHRNIFRLITLA